ncbi:hypothetical protein AAFC00_003571 [Neodothiora populina]|uniref:Zn(2)-C6 fungal-type domain-containing protein n=1 Tax=Neodothiora populina TaxID=2781224 RepID=A0ABR3PEM3_9PEZI
MPRHKDTNAPEPKRRSRTGCWQCKARKVKCGEEKPQCTNCVKQGEQKCDYGLRLQWGGRSKKDQDAFAAKSQVDFAVNWTPSPSAPSTPMATASSQSSRLSRQLPPIGSGEVTFSVQSPRSNTPGSSSHGQKLTLDPQLKGKEQAVIQTSPGKTVSEQNVRTWQAQNEHLDSNRQGHVADPLRAPASHPHQPSTYYRTQSSETYAPPPASLHSAPSPIPPTEDNASEQHRAKRSKTSHTDTGNALPPLFIKPDLPVASSNIGSPLDQATPSSAVFSSFSPSSHVFTPASPDSSIMSEESDARSHPRLMYSNTRASPAVRRLPVSSLLSGSPDDASSPVAHNSRPGSRPRIDHEGSTMYGYDYGRPDLDIAKNDDATGIMPYDSGYGGSTANSPEGYSAATSAYQQASQRTTAFESGGYYEKPVPIRISKELEPLPSYLTESPMNLLYFHHFLNHTARVLTPHDCPDNPLRTILPKMAINHPDLLNLLLAYSASHRARLLAHAEPRDRIAYWVRDVFSNLRHALASQVVASDATLATAIMLASREIITPNTFEVDIPWQNHLGIARQMIIIRGGLQDMGNNGSVFLNFLARWFAYLDVIGSLSGHTNDIPLSEAYPSISQGAVTHSEETDSHGFAIDCFFGFSNCCISLLARVAKLAHESDKERINADRQINPDWRPSETARVQAQALVEELRASGEHVYAGCRHSPGVELPTKEPLDKQEIVSVNEAFHLAGMIHVYRRVLGRSGREEEVQTCVRQIIKLLSKIRRGGSAESCLLFPMFTAGCDAIEQEQRAVVLERLKLVEGLGMTHVTNARLLMQKSWESGKPWELLVSGEFFG